VPGVRPKTKSFDKAQSRNAATTGFPDRFKRNNANSKSISMFKPNILQSDNENLMNINGADIEIMGNSNIPRGAFLTQPYTNMHNSQEDASSMTREFALTGFNNPAIMVSSCAATVPD
jgi:hypothetical protein